MKQRVWAAIDIGTNSVRLLLKEKIGSIEKEKKYVCITQLGQGLSQQKHLCEQAMNRTQEAVIRFAEMAVEKGAQKPVWCYATSAARQADNGMDFLNRLTQSGWVTAELLSGEEEAEAAYIGSQAKGEPVLDVGGGSTELTMQQGDGLLGKSIPLGCVTLKEKYLTEDRMQDEQRNLLREECFAKTAQLTDAILMEKKVRKIVGVGGTATQLAMLELGLPEYQPEKVHGLELTYEDVQRWYGLLSRMTMEERKGLPGMEAKRADIIVCGAAIIVSVLGNARAESLVVSDKDGLDGYLQRKMERILDK